MRLGGSRALLVAVKSHLLRRSPIVASRLSYNRRNLDFNTACLRYSQVGKNGGDLNVIRGDETSMSAVEHGEKF